MKRNLIKIFVTLLIPVFILQFSELSYADMLSDKTETGIHFESSTEPSTSYPQTTKPLKPSGNGNLGGSLPHLGQLFTSFILLLSGFACLIVAIGVMFLRRIYRIHT